MHSFLSKPLRNYLSSAFSIYSIRIPKRQFSITNRRLDDLRKQNNKKTNGGSMKKVLLLITISLVLNCNVQSQNSKAKEIWSEPIPIDTITINKKYFSFNSPAMNKTLDTLYYRGDDGIYRAFKDKLTEKWQTEKLGKTINNPDTYVPETVSVSRDGKRLYITYWTNFNGKPRSWDLWKSEWNATMGDWKTPEHMGDSVDTNYGINTKYYDLYLYEVSEDTIYIIQSYREPESGSNAINPYIKEKETGKWRFVKDYLGHLHQFNDGNNRYGISITGNKKKLYSCVWFGQGETLDERIISDWDLIVTYRDSTTNLWEDQYYFLNINSRGKLIDPNDPLRHAGGRDAYPWISEDGKVLIFMSNRQAWYDSAGIDMDEFPNIYISYLLVDENGKPVGVEVDENNNILSYHLFQNYPNPFNGSTVISYNLPKQQKVELIVYDILGNEIMKLVDREENAGIHTIRFNPNRINLSSGIYIYSLKTPQKQISKQMIFLK